MTNKKRIISMASAVVLTALIVLSLIFLSEQNKKFTLTEKSVIAMGTVVTEKIYSGNPGSAISDITAAIREAIAILTDILVSSSVCFAVFSASSVRAFSAS